jgi:hypothetical protein
MRWICDCRFVASTSSDSTQPITVSSSHELAVIDHPSLSIEAMNPHWHAITIGSKTN